MSKTLYFIVVIITVATAFFGYLNYQRYEKLAVEKNKMMSEQHHLFEGLTKELSLTKETLATQTIEITKNKEDLQSALLAQKKALADLTVVEKQLTDAGITITQQKNDIVAKDATIQQLQQQLLKVEQSGVSSVKGTEVKKNLEEALAKLKVAQAQIQEFKQRDLDQKRKFSNGGFEGKVLAVNPTWNFIVINLGDQNGVIKGSEMLVKRDAQIVAKVKITSVEPLTSIADIIPESVAPGSAVQTGDVIVYTGAKSTQ